MHLSECEVRTESKYVSTGTFLRPWWGHFCKMTHLSARKSELKSGTFLKKIHDSSSFYLTAKIYLIEHTEGCLGIKITQKVLTLQYYGKRKPVLH